MNENINPVKDIRISDFDYPLPDERIARHPLQERDACRLLVSLPDGRLLHKVFSDLPDLLPADSVLVCNNTRVINARIQFEKSTGSRIEIFLLEPVLPEDYNLMFQSVGSCEWSCMIGNLKRWKSGSLFRVLNIGGKEVTLTATRCISDGGANIVRFEWTGDGITFAQIVDVAGNIPIPPYLKRDSEISDLSDYQTVYAKIKGSVAAPTAGLHFTPSLFSRLEGRGINIIPLTLHVGAGTFQPVKSETIGDHPMHTEVISVSRMLLEGLIKARSDGKKIVAVGTTTVRTLESLPYLGMAIASGDESLHVDQWQPYTGDRLPDRVCVDKALKTLVAYMDKKGLAELTASTSIMIAPGFRWNIVDVMVTNFHQPQSTLLLLVSSFLDRNIFTEGAAEVVQWRRIYDEALREGYRFLSYGDACLLFPLSE